MELQHGTLQVEGDGYIFAPLTFDLLSPAYIIMQAIRVTIKTLPIQTTIFHVKAHQDQHKAWEELDKYAQINVLADKQADKIYGKTSGQTRPFPTWVPGTLAALFDSNMQMTKDIPSYIRDAKHTSNMKQYLIRRSTEATGRDKSWDEDTYTTI
jgi:hypothetical protein